MIDRSVIGTRTPGETLLISRSRLRAFAKATGQTDPTYVDVEAAQAAGHRDLPVPPTFLFGIDLEAPDPFKTYADLGIDLRRILHGEQAFTYHSMAYAGDELRTSSVITDVYDKKGGLLKFLVRSIEVHDQDDVLIAEMTTTIVVQNPPEQAAATSREAS